MWLSTPTYDAFNAAFGRRFRPRRMLAFCDTFGVSPETRVLDIGGTFYNWSLLPAERRPRLTLLNTDPPSPGELPADVRYLRASALDLPFGPGAFDIIFSNSVIEHVGDWDAQRRFAREIQRLGAPYWVQTPNYYFPVEPHFLGVGVQFLPRPLALRYARWATAWGWMHRNASEDVALALDDIRLLKPRDMRALFPNGDLRSERLLGLTKSLIAVSSPTPGTHGD